MSIEEQDTVEYCVHCDRPAPRVWPIPRWPDAPDDGEVVLCDRCDELPLEEVYEALRSEEMNEHAVILGFRISQFGHGSDEAQRAYNTWAQSYQRWRAALDAALANDPSFGSRHREPEPEPPPVNLKHIGIGMARAYHDGRASGIFWGIEAAYVAVVLAEYVSPWLLGLPALLVVWAHSNRPR